MVVPHFLVLRVQIISSKRWKFDAALRALRSLPYKKLHMNLQLQQLYEDKQSIIIQLLSQFKLVIDF